MIVRLSWSGFGLVLVLVGWLGWIGSASSHMPVQRSFFFIHSFYISHSSLPPLALAHTTGPSRPRSEPKTKLPPNFILIPSRHFASLHHQNASNIIYNKSSFGTGFFFSFYSFFFCFVLFCGANLWFPPFHSDWS